MKVYNGEYFVRSYSESKLHKKAIELTAMKYIEHGYRVMADHIKSFQTPETIGVIKPDLIVEKNGFKGIIEIETPSTIGTKRDKMQRKYFSRWANKTSKRFFEREIAVEPRERYEKESNTRDQYKNRVPLIGKTLA